MAELTFDVLLSDTARFPDSMAWPLDDGSTVTLGTLRAGLRSSYVPQTDHETLRRQSDEQRQALLREKQALEQNNALMQQQLIERLSTPTAPAAADAVPDIYKTDPLFKPMYDELTSTRAMLTKMNEMLTQQETQQRQMYQTVSQIPVVMQVQKIQAKDPSIDPQALLQFARDHQIQPQFLEDAAALMTREAAIAKAREEGMTAGLEKAKADFAGLAPQVPYAPFGPPQVMPQPQPQFASDQALEQAMLQDAEMYQVFMGQA